MKANRIVAAGFALCLSCTILAAIAWSFQRGKAELQRRALDNELTITAQRISSRLQAAISEFRKESAQQLLAMHYEGLSHQLRRWSAENPAIETAFQWDPANGFSGGEIAPQATRRLEKAFGSLENDSNGVDRIIRYGEAGSINWNSGYFLENVENLQYEGFTPNPVVVWQRIDSLGASKEYCWHRLGDGQPIRGFSINDAHLTAALVRLARNSAPANIDLHLHASEPSNAGESPAKRVDLPSWNRASIFAMFKPDRLDAYGPSRLSSGLIVVCFGLAIACIALITIQSSRKYREALRRTNFVTNVSHELKTPITSIGIHADLLTNTDLDPAKQLRFASTISNQCDRLSRMVDDFLSLSKLDSRNGVYARDQVDIKSLCQETLAECDPILREAGLRYTVQIQSSSPYLDTDADALKRILVSLIENASKYAQRAGNLEIVAKEDADKLALFVNDDGPGIAKEHAETIFDPFTQLDEDLSRKTGGSGIGLSIARKIARDLGGELSLNSEFTKGASFKIELPK